PFAISHEPEVGLGSRARSAHLHSPLLVQHAEWSEMSERWLKACRPDHRVGRLPRAVLPLDAVWRETPEHSAGVELATFTCSTHGGHRYDVPEAPRWVRCPPFLNRLVAQRRLLEE